MDLANLGAEIAKDEEGVPITIYKKNGDPYTASDGSPATVTVLGSESQRYRDARDAITRKVVNAPTARRREIEPSELRKNRVALCTAAIVDWHGWEGAGKNMPCTPTNVAILLSADHVLEQVEAGIGSHADFFDNALPDSVTT